MRDKRSRSFRLGLPSSRTKNAGFSLIEVMIATAILMGSAVVLSRLAGMGRDQSQKAKIYSDAQQVCEQTLSELLLGMRPVELVEAMPLLPLPTPVEQLRDETVQQDLFLDADSEAIPIADEANPEWRYSVRTSPLSSMPGIWALTVEVLQGDQTLNRPIRFALTRWISGPPPEGAFEEFHQDRNEPEPLQQGGLL